MQPPINLTTISWIPPTAQNTPVSQYIVTYTNTCPSDEHHTQTGGGVTVSSSSASTTITLQLGQLYNISVSVSNAVGVSPAVSVLYWTPARQGKIGLMFLLILHTCMLIVLYSS